MTVLHVAVTVLYVTVTVLNVSVTVLCSVVPPWGQKMASSTMAARGR